METERKSKKSEHPKVEFHKLGKQVPEMSKGPLLPLKEHSHREAEAWEIG